MTTTRRLAAILASDVAGYSRLIGADEEGTLDRLRAIRRELVDPKITEHHGRIVKTTGDGMLVEFASVVDAVRCAVQMQRDMEERNAEIPTDIRIEFRVGINLGDIIIAEDNDIHGDGVNVAARLEGIADPGGICISGTVRDHIGDRLDLTFDDIGDQALKNIARPLRVYRVRLATAETVPNASSVKTTPTLALPDKPSIAVLPFQNMSGDPEQEYFADGMVEEIITALSRIRWLFVIARNSTFTYKGQAVDVKQVGRELGVRYVLEGSVRKGGNQVRITAQLIDAETGAHLWADRFDGTLEDVFDLQDQVTASVVGAIAPKLEQVEISRAKRKPTESLDAYDNYLRGVAALHSVFEGNEESVSEALHLFYRAVELDPEFAAAYGMAAWCYVLRKNYGWIADDAHEAAELERVARQATRLAREDAVALYTGGFALTRVVGDLDASAALIDQALSLDPNLAAAWHLSGWVRILLGESELAIAHMAQAMRLNPLDPLIFGMQNGTAAAHFLAGRYDEASSWAETALRTHANYAPALRIAAASHALAGRFAEAKKFMTRMRQIDRRLRVSKLADLAPFRRPEDFVRYAEGLRKAGLPEE
jgi:TolB-like protein/class 3 adenylate cyclase/tetratricopeptide (TPR) repeat protein